MSDIVMQVDIDSARQQVLDTLTTEAGIKGWWTDRAEVPSGAGGILKPSFPGIPPSGVPSTFDLKVEEAGAGRVVWRTQSFPPNFVGTEVTWELSDGPGGRGTRV